MSATSARFNQVAEPLLYCFRRTPDSYWRTKIIVVVVAVACFLLFLTPAADPFSSAREKMVKEQIESRGIRDAAVLGAIRATPRHLFVPAALQSNAYEDHPLPIGHGATISQPYVVAWMTELLQPAKTDRVLEVGTGSGY